MTKLTTHPTTIPLPRTHSDPIIAGTFRTTIRETVSPSRSEFVGALYTQPTPSGEAFKEAFLAWVATLDLPLTLSPLTITLSSLVSRDICPPGKGHFLRRFGEAVTIYSKEDLIYYLIERPRRFTPTEMAKVLLPPHLFSLFQEKLDRIIFPDTFSWNWNDTFELQADILATLIWDHHTGVLP